MSNKTPSQILVGYMQRLSDRQRWLHEKINILKSQKKPYGYEQEEFYAVQFVQAFVEAQEQLALEHIKQDLQTRSDREKQV